MIRLLFFLVVLLSFSRASSFPPPIPSAGVVERELEREYEGVPLEPERPLPSIKIDIPKERLEIPDGMRVFIDCVVIEGNESLCSENILHQIDGYLHEELTLCDIYEICMAIEDYYAEKGYFLARAYPPPQTIENGILHIEVIEGKLGNVTVIGNKYYSTCFIESYFRSLQGKPLCYKEFVHALMLVTDNSDLLAGALFEKGEEFGYADVIIRVHDERPVHLYFNGNNYGRNLTTNSRMGGRFDWGSAITEGDKISLAQVVGFPINALYFSDVIYTVPLNRKGTFLEFAYLHSKFDIEELTPLHLRGISDIGTIKVNQAVIRTQSLSLDFYSYFDIKQVQNFVLGKRVSYDKLRVLTLGTLIDRFVPNSGRDYLSVNFAAGIPDFLGGLKCIDKESSRLGAGGRFFILSGEYERIQPLPFDTYFYFHTAGQVTPNKLTLPELFYIGGVDSVRGFPLAYALGDTGYFVNCEFRFPPLFFANKQVFKFNKKWKDIMQFDAFLDQGGTFLQSEGNTFLWGTGVGVRLKGFCGLNVTFDLGIPLNHRGSNRSVFTYLKLTWQPL